MRFLIIILFSIPLYAEESKVICELDGTYSITYKDIKKTYLSEGIEFFKNLATQTQQSLFLLQRAKTSFASEDWEKDKMYVVQYWEADTQNEKFKSLVHTFDPSPIWLNPKANWESKVTKNGIEVTHSMKAGEEHPLFPEYDVDFYRVTNTFNWYTGKGKIQADIWLKNKKDSKNSDPKVEVRASGQCSPQKKKF